MTKVYKTLEKMKLFAEQHCMDYSEHTTTNNKGKFDYGLMLRFHNRYVSDLVVGNLKELKLQSFTHSNKDCPDWLKPKRYQITTKEPGLNNY